MKRSLFFTLLFACSVLSAQTVTGVDANQVGKTIEITYHLDRTADISLDYSTDGGRTYKPLHRVSGDVGRGITAGHRTITWDVLSELENLIADVSFRVNATSGMGYENGHEWVDLGLSVKWATCNVGANKPEKYGNYYAWGETTTKNYYDWSTYKWCNGSYSTLTKYNTDCRDGTVDNKTVLELADDAARANWGGAWRMPTNAEWTELRENCTWTWTDDYNGTNVNGQIVTSKINGNSIFLPSAGYRDGGGLYSVGSCGDYWSSSLYSGKSGDAYNLSFSSDLVDWYNGYRYFGRSVRGVFSK